ncbi:MAG: multidrug effflux MFS transporter [Ahrensia sp.]|nr:multidrug effflux MFS transporter [Ahrensia sp.]
MPPLWILILLAAVSPLAINIFLPSMPSISRDLGASYATIQLGLSLYLMLTAVVSLIVGPVSDKIGRRPVLLSALCIFIIGSLLCIFATSAPMFLAGRVIQTASAAGLVLSRAIVRDVYPREKSASMIGYVIMGMAIAPMIGPIIGGFIDSIANWRWSFGVLAAFGAVALIATWISLPETNTFAGQTVAAQLHSYRQVMTMRLFWLYTASASLASAVFFAFLGGGPAVSAEFFKQTPFEYGLWFSMTAAGYAIGNGLSGKFSERVGVERMMTYGAVVTIIGPLISLLFLTTASEPAAWMLFVPMVFVGLGNGMTLPNVMAAAISLKPDAAGATSGLLGALQIGGGAIASIIGARAVGQTGSPLALCTSLAIFAAAAFVVTLSAARRSRPQPSAI